MMIHTLPRTLIIIVLQDLEPDNILKRFLNFTKLELHYSYKIHSYMWKVDFLRILLRTFDVAKFCNINLK